MRPSTQLIRALLACTVSLVGSLSATGAGDVASDGSSGLLLGKVMAGLPRYGEIKNTAAPTDSETEVEPGITHLVPLVIFGKKKSLKFDELALLTEKAREAAIRKQYGSLFEYREEKRLRDAMKLKDYASNLKLAGDHLESASIQKEIDRLLVGRNNDWASQDIDRLFNARYR